MIEKDCNDWKKLWWLKKIVVKEIYACNKMLVNAVIKAVLNSLFYFFTKRFCMHQKHQKQQKHKDATKQKHKNSNKRISDFFPHRCFLSSFFIFVHCKWFVLCACGIFQWRSLKLSWWPHLHYYLRTKFLKPVSLLKQESVSFFN